MYWLWQDARYALRTLVVDRTFFLTAVIALALGIGSTTAIFSVIYNVLLAPFPYTDGQRLYGVEVRDKTSKDDFGRQFFSVPEFLDWQEQNHVFDRSIGVRRDPILMTGKGAPESLDGATVTGNTFQFLGVQPLLGRVLTPEDAKLNAPPVFVLSYKVWQKRFAGDTSILNKVFTFNDRPTTLVGIMPPRFAWWGADLWVPTRLDRSESGPTGRFFFILGHLKSGITEKQASADLQILGERFAKVYPKDYPKQFRVRPASLIDNVVGKFRTTLYTLLAAVGLLLLIACANVANLLLARANAREKEFAIRSTLGAGRWRVIRQLLVESVCLAFAGAAVGCMFAWAGLKGLVALIPKFTFPDEANIHLNLPVLIGTVATAILTALLFGLAPAMGASKRNINEPLKAAGRGNSGFRRGRLRNILIVSEVALSLVLLVAAGLFMRSFFLEKQIDLGFNTEKILTTQLQLTKEYKTAERQSQFLRDVLGRLKDLPGVVGVAGAVAFPPFGGPDSNFEVAGKTHSQTWKGQVAMCSADFFRTLGARLLKGRYLTETDVSTKRKVTLINQTLASQYFPNEDPIGKQIKIVGLASMPVPLENPWFEIVGVISDIKNHGLTQSVVPEVYPPYTFSSYGGYALFIRTVGNPIALTKEMSGAVLAVDRTVVPSFTYTMQDSLDLFEFSKPRFGLILFSVFAGVGLILVSVGVYSVIAYTVQQQYREIGIRMALGASAGAVRQLVILAGLRFIMIGLGVGLVLAFVSMRLMSSQIWGVHSYDPLTLISVIVLLTFVGLMASYLPSRRATRVDPMVSLRYE